MYKGTLLALALDIEGMRDRNYLPGNYGLGMQNAYDSVLDLIDQRLAREDG